MLARYTILKRVPERWLELPSYQPHAAFSISAVLMGVVLTLFSPMVAFYLLALLLVLGGPWLTTSARWAGGVLLAINGALIHSSRRVLATSSDDVNNYYRNYEQVQDSWESVFRFGDGLEPLLSLYFKLLHLLPVELSPTGLILAVSLLCSLLFWLWLERHAVNQFGAAERAMLVAASFVFFHFFMTTQMMRQMLAFCIVIHAISAKDHRSGAAIAVLATLTHLTALPMYVLALLYKYRIEVGHAVVLFTIGSIVFLFPFLIQVYETGNLDFIPGSGKLSRYTRGHEGYTQSDMEMYRILVVTFFAFLVLQGRPIFYQYWPAIFLGLFLIYLFSLPYSLMSLRSALLITAVLTGFFIVYSVRGYLLPFAGMLGLFCIYRLLRRGLMYSDSGGPFSRWVEYPMADWLPFYYLPAFVA